jgi:hypothetical protein
MIWSLAQCKKNLPDKIQTNGMASASTMGFAEVMLCSEMQMSAGLQPNQVREKV